MEAITTITGTAVPLDRSDVDTDQIIPSDWLKRVERTGFGEGLFSEWRENENFVLNQPQYDGAVMLIAGENFGTGSSREHAVWSLMDYGFQAVISPRFGDIFKNNCTKAGLLPVELDASDVDRLMNAVTKNPSTEITIDVAQRSVISAVAGVSASFPLDNFTQYRLLNGLDDVGLTLQHGDAIDEYESRRVAWLPSTA